MGDTLRFARRMQLVDLEPRADLTSTGSALANPGQTYVVLQLTAEPFIVTLRAATYAIEWYGLEDRQTCQAGSMVVASETRVSFASPFPARGPCVLYVQRTEL